MSDIKPRTRLEAEEQSLRYAEERLARKIIPDAEYAQLLVLRQLSRENIARLKASAPEPSAESELLYDLAQAVGAMFDDDCARVNYGCNSVRTVEDVLARIPIRPTPATEGGGR